MFPEIYFIPFYSQLLIFKQGNNAEKKKIRKLNMNTYYK